MMAVAPYIAILAVVAAMVVAQGKRVRAHQVALHGLLTLAVLAAGVDVMGRPKPLALEWRGGGELEVTAAQYHPGQAIYIWTRSAPPVVYRLPWDVETAREMQQATQASGGVVLKRGERQRGAGETPDSEWSVHPLPQPSNPPKSGAS